MKRESKISNNKELVIEFTGINEPNNGRMLWKVNILLNEESQWNYLTIELDHWDLENESYYYLPIEGRAKLISKEDKSILETDYQSLSTSRFLGNCFSDQYLFEIYRDSIQKINLKTFVQTKIEYQVVGRIRRISISSKQNLNLYFYDNDYTELVSLCRDAKSLIEKFHADRMDLKYNNEIKVLYSAVSKISNAENLEVGQIVETRNKINESILPTSDWTDLLGPTGEAIVNKILAKTTDLIHGRLETIEC